MKDEKSKNPNAVALGKLGGQKGGAARAKSLSKERRQEIAIMAAERRWHKKEIINDLYYGDTFTVSEISVEFKTSEEEVKIILGLI